MLSKLGCFKLSETFVNKARNLPEWSLGTPRVDPPSLATSIRLGLK